MFSSDGREHVNKLREWYTEGVEEFLAADDSFRAAWDEFDPDDEAVRALQRQALIDLGKSMLEPEEGECPLCQEPWVGEELEQHLETRLEEAHHLRERRQELKDLRGEALQHLSNVRVRLKSFIELIEQDDHFESEPFEAYRETVEEWEAGYDCDILAEPIYDDLGRDERKSILTPESLATAIREIEDTLGESPDLQEFEEIWSDLGAVESRLSDLRQARSLAKQYAEAASQMETVHQSYVEAKDAVLGEIYTEIEDQFAEYYSMLHSDESDISVELETTTAGLNLGVDFHERGMHPPARSGPSRITARDDQGTPSVWRGACSLTSTGGHSHYFTKWKRPVKSLTIDTNEDGHGLVNFFK